MENKIISTDSQSELSEINFSSDVNIFSESVKILSADLNSQASDPHNIEMRKQACKIIIKFIQTVPQIISSDEGITELLGALPHSFSIPDSQLFMSLQEVMFYIVQSYYSRLSVFGPTICQYINTLFSVDQSSYVVGVLQFMRQVANFETDQVAIYEAQAPDNVYNSKMSAVILDNTQIQKEILGLSPFHTKLLTFQFIQKHIGTLFQMMIPTNPEDIAVEDFEGQRELCMDASLTFDAFYRTVPPLVFDFICQTFPSAINSENWTTKHAALMMLSSLTQTCKNHISDLESSFLNENLSIILDGVRCPIPRIMETAFYVLTHALKKFPRLISTESRVENQRRVNMILDLCIVNNEQGPRDNKILLREILLIYRIAVLFSECGIYLNPLNQEMIQKMFSIIDNIMLLESTNEKIITNANKAKSTIIRSVSVYNLTDSNNISGEPLILFLYRDTIEKIESFMEIEEMDKSIVYLHISSLCYFLQSILLFVREDLIKDNEILNKTLNILQKLLQLHTKQVFEESLNVFSVFIQQFQNFVQLNPLIIQTFAAFISDALISDSPNIISSGLISLKCLFKTYPTFMIEQAQPLLIILNRQAIEAFQKEGPYLEILLHYLQAIGSCLICRAKPSLEQLFVPTEISESITESLLLVDTLLKKKFDIHEISDLEICETIYTGIASLLTDITLITQFGKKYGKDSENFQKGILNRIITMSKTIIDLHLDSDILIDSFYQLLTKCVKHISRRNNTLINKRQVHIMLEKWSSEKPKYNTKIIDLINKLHNC